MFGKTGNVSLDRRVCRKGDEADRERAVTPSGAVRSSSEEKAIRLVAASPEAGSDQTRRLGGPNINLIEQYPRKRKKDP
jgi:hypothetical protein